MIEHRAIRSALRTRLLTLSVCTTGSTTLTATSTGYTRASGSFVTDGFAIGMETTAAGFSTSENNGTGVITAVSALSTTITPYTITAAVGGYTYASRAPSAESATATLSVGLPAIRAWENVETSTTAGVPYVVEEYLPGPSFKATLGPLGEVEGQPLYALKIHVPAGGGPEAADAYADALLAHFATGLSLTGTGWTLWVRGSSRGDSGPYRGQLLQSSPGYAVVPITVPLRVRTANAL